MNRFLSWTSAIVLALVSLTASSQSAGQYSFSATSGTFTPIAGTDTVTAIHADSRLSDPIAIGFSFDYEGITYTHLKASSNSFLQLDTTKTSSRTTNDLDNVNEPIIAPFWDDNDGRATGGSYASYVVTGTAPNRVFTFEWLNWEWRYNSTTATISAQVKLYETSNNIEFVYRPESGTVSSGTASIGLCGLGTGAGTFLSLNGFGTNPTASSTSETTNISTKPASGQTYTFSPPTCLAPNMLRDSAITATSAIFNFNTTASSSSVYDGYYQVSGSSTPTSFNGLTSGASNSVSLTGLTAATSYDVFVRVVCSVGDTSAYASYTFSTLYPTPQTVDFVGFTGSNLSTLFSGWSEAEGWPTPTGTTSVWTGGGTTQETALGSETAKINLYTTNRDEWIVSPRVAIVSTDSLRFDAAITSYNGTGTSNMGSDDTVKVLISTNGGTTWSTLMNFTALNAPSNSLQRTSMSLSTYAGQSVQIAWYAQDGPINDPEDYDFHLANLFIGTPPNIDMSGTGAFTVNSCLSASEPVYAIVENKAAATINFATSNTTVGVKISGAGSGFLSTTLTTDTLGAGDTLHVLVGTTNMTASGTYTLNSYTDVSGDGNASNDTSSNVNVVQDSTYAMPQKVDFAGFTGSNLSSVFPGWSEAGGWPLPTGTTGLWNAGNASQQTHFGTTTAKVNLYTTNRDEWIISPKMNASAGDSLIFKAAITGYNGTGTEDMGSDDSVKVLVSSDCGASWTMIQLFTASNQPSNSFTEYRLGLGAYAGGPIQVAFYAQDGPINDPEDYDFHITDIFIGTPPTNDIGVTAILDPMSGVCGEDSTEVRVAVHNFGVQTQSSIGITVDVSGSATTTLTNSIASLAPGVSDTIVVGTFNTRAGGTFNMTAYNTQVGDQDNSNDTSKVTGVSIGAIPTTPTVASSATVCSGTDTILVASGTTASYRWYIQGIDSVIATGDTLSLMNLQSNATYEVEGLNFASDQVGATTTPTGGFITTSVYGIGFDVNISEVELDSVTMYPTGTGWFIVHVSDYSGTPLYSADTVFVTGASLTKTRVPLNLTVPSGKYKMTMTYSGITSMGREFGMPFPYNSTSGAVTLVGGSTGTGNPTSTSYYWFYDWAITVPSCPSDRAASSITVNPLPVFDLGPDTAFCGASSINYTLDATTTGGSYLWDDASTMATRTVTAAGQFWCQVSLNGCAVTDTVNVGANPLPAVNFPNPANVCANADTLSLSGATPAGGMYWGTNVNGGVFDPVAAGAGMDTLYYTYTDSIGCSATDTAMINVDTIPTVSLTAFNDICIDNGNVPLMGGMPMGGTYSGTGVVGIAFVPDSAGVGTHTISYSYTDGNGCSDSTSENITVNALPMVSVSVQPAWCLNAAPIVLNTGMPAGGTYEINGVVDTVYAPMTAGNDTIVYEFTDSNSCVNRDTAFVTANAVPAVTFGTIPSACVGGSSVTLSQGAPAGGMYSGNNVNGNLYNPSMVGTDTLKYAYTDSNMCSDSAFSPITVNALPNVTLSALNDVCDNTPSFALAGGAPTGGSYTGTGTSGGNFDASAAGVGTHPITYTYTDGNGCSNSDMKDIVVNAVTAANLSFLGFICDNADAKDLTAFGTPAGGTFSGNGINGTNFDPAAAGLGASTIQYSFTNAANCMDSTTADITVEASPTFTITGDTDGCGTGSNAPLLKSSATGLTYRWSTGSNADSTYVYASGQVWLKVTDQNTNERCFNTDTTTVTYEDVCVGIDEALAGTSVKYFPNPNNGTFNYSVEGFEGLNIEVSIVNAAGQVVFTDNWNNVSDSHNGQIRLEGMESGLYFINLSTEKGSVMHRISITH